MTRRRSPKISKEMAAHVRFLMATRRFYQHQVAALLGVNQGRISEIVREQRFPGVPAAPGPFPM